MARIPASAAMAALTAGCLELPAENHLLHGLSNALVNEAGGELSPAVRNAAAFGGKPTSGGIGIGPEAVRREFDVHAIVECPDGTPELLPATGAPVP